MVSFSDFNAKDNAGNSLEYSSSAVLSPRTVTMDNTQPSIISVELSTDNILSGTLFDNVTGQSIDNHSVVRFGDNVTLKFETSERVMNGLSVRIHGQITPATAQIIDNTTDKSGTKWQAVYLVKDNDTGLVNFTEFSANDPAGNLISYDSSITSTRSVTVDNLQPEIISVAWSTDNLSKILFDNVTGDNLTDELVVRYLDNVTLNFETSERMVDFPKVLINGIEKTASKQIVNGNTDITATKWMVVYEVRSFDSGLLDYSDFIGSDPAGNPVTVFNPVISTKRVTVDNQAPEIKVVAFSTDNRLSGNLYDSNGVQRG